MPARRVFASLVFAALSTTAGQAATWQTHKYETDSDTSLTGIGDRARAIHASKCNGGTIRVGAKFFLVGKWFYQLAYLIAPEANAADAEHFLQSFKLVAK